MGSWFHRAVVLICHHDAEGAFGLVLNRPSGTDVGEALAGEFSEVLRQQPLYIGGPVQPGALSFLHTESYLPNGSVMPNVNLGHSLDQLIELASEFSPGRQILVFAGYAGWSAGQLEDELARDAWLVHPATPELIFDGNPEQLWSKILKSRGGIFRLLADAPEDPSWN